MSSAAIPPGSPDLPHDHDHSHAHPEHVAHHFDTAEQQFDAAKVGMWVFLATEILMFGGLFAWYALWRGLHPDVFLYAHHHLDWKLGMTNTFILIASSFTMAWAVRAAQLGQRGLLVLLLALSIAGGCGFLVVKSFEYHAKWEHGLWIGSSNKYFQYSKSEGGAAAATNAEEPGEHDEPSEAGHKEPHAKIEPPRHPLANSDWPEGVPPDLAFQSNVPHAQIYDSDVATDRKAEFVEEPVEAKHQETDHKDASGHGEEKLSGGHGGKKTFAELSPFEKRRTYQFFQMYFLMTGLHTLHVIIGIGLIGWLLLRSIGFSFAGSSFSPQYYLPVDLVGLYWHLVDLIWIFLFPLLYLIH